MKSRESPDDTVSKTHLSVVIKDHWVAYPANLAPTNGGAWRLVDGTLALVWPLGQLETPRGGSAEGLGR